MLCSIGILSPHFHSTVLGIESKINDCTGKYRIERSDSSKTYRMPKRYLKSSNHRHHSEVDWKFPWLVVHHLMQWFKSSNRDSEEKHFSPGKGDGIIFEKQMNHKSIAAQSNSGYSLPSLFHSYCIIL